MSRSAAARQLRAVFERYQEETWALFPQDASDLGLHAYDALLGPNDAAAWNAHGRLLTETLQAVEALPDNGFTGDDWLDRRTFLARLRTDSLWNGPLQTWRTNPQVHCDTALHSLFHLVIRNTDRLARIRPAIENRLAEIPRFLYYQSSTRQGFFWWEIDLTYYGLRLLAALGVIWDLRPVPARMREARRNVEPAR